MKLKKLLASLLSFTTMVTMAAPMAVFAENTNTDMYSASKTVDDSNNNSAVGKSFDIDFTTMTEVPIYSIGNGKGFVSESSAIMPTGYGREVANPSEITVSADGAKVTESSGSYLKQEKDDNNYGGLIYRVDTGAPGAYHIEVQVTDSTNIGIAPTGMTAGRLTSTSEWDDSKLVKRLTSAKWEDSKWSYDFATGEDFIEIELEPTVLPTAEKPITVGIKSLKITPLATNPKEDKPTIHILGDSTQKTYTFYSTLSSWGQTLIDYFDTNKVNVVNYSMGGRSMRDNYKEGRTDDVLIRGKEGDFVFIHSAHNDETNNSQKRDVRGTNLTTSEKPTDDEYKQYRDASNALYNRWLDMYVEAIKARGMIPVLVTPMPRIGSSGKWSQSEIKPNGFYPDSPGNMREKAKEDGVALIELYEGAKQYIDSLDGDEVLGIYNKVEAGEMPGGADSSAANGNSGDGTHFKESAGRQWCRIMLQSMYDQSTATTDTYTDKNIMTELVSYTKEEVQNSMASGDWSKVFPEMAEDVSAVGIVPGAQKQTKDNYYFRNSIEKVLQLGIMQKDSSNKFYPTNSITVGEFARSAEKAFGLDAGSLENYNKTYAELQEAGATEIIIGSDDPEDKSPAIANAEISNGNTVVTLKNITSGVVVAAKYEEGKLKDTKNVPVSGDTVTVEGIEADSVFVWNSIEEMKPLCKSYSISSKSNEVNLVANRDYTITVDPVEGGTITLYNESDYQHKTVDISETVEKESIIADNDYFTLISPNSVVFGNDKNGVFLSNNEITTSYIESKKADVHFNYKAKTTGTLTAYVAHVETKTVNLVDVSDNKTQAKYLFGKAGTDNQTRKYAAIEFDVEAGKEYTLYTNSGTGRLFGVQYSTKQESSTESLSVNSGTKVKVVVERKNAKWRLESILKDGAVINDGSNSFVRREYTFTVDGNTTISAKFNQYSEPELIEAVLIASDAPLTREAMAAILYDAYLLKYGKKDDGTLNTVDYMTKYNKTSGVGPLDPNYDPNIKQEGNYYWPITGWDTLKDVDSINKAFYGKAKQVYNIGLMRSDLEYSRGLNKNGETFEPAAKVTRARAAKALFFVYILTQPELNESQVLPNGNLASVTGEIIAPNENAPSKPFEIKQ